MEAHGIDRDAGCFESRYNLIDQQRQLLCPAGRCDVHRELTPALRTGFGARGDAFADDAPPLLAIDHRAGEARGRLT